MDARKVLGASETDTMYTVKQWEPIKLYGQALVKAPYAVDKIRDLIDRAVSAFEAIKWEHWRDVVDSENPWDDYSGKPPKATLIQWLADYKGKDDLPFLENERDKAFRDRYFNGLNRVLLSVGGENEIDLGDISEHDVAGRIRQGYLAELRGDTEGAKAIYDSVGFTERKMGNE